MQSMQELRLVIPAELEGCTLRHAALCVLHMSSGQFKRAKFHGTVLLDGVPALANARLKTGQVLALCVPEPANTKPVACDIPFGVAYEDEHFLVVDKPAPLPSSSASAKQEGPTLENALYAYLGCPDGFVYRPVNRLDKGTSGLMLVAKTAHAQHLLQQQLHSERFVREYLAVAQGVPPLPEGCIDLPIAKADGATVRREVSALGKEARTYYKLLRTGNGRSLLWLKLDTGRTHQIRVHLQAIGCPVAGDFLYGTELEQLPRRFALHSARLCVLHPITGEWVEAVSTLPQVLEGLLEGEGIGIPR
ncbi:MAG: RluA family pseudouridine synthase [Clostridia bacterium]